MLVVGARVKDDARDFGGVVFGPTVAKRTGRNVNDRSVVDGQSNPIHAPPHPIKINTIPETR